MAGIIPCSGTESYDKGHNAASGRNQGLLRVARCELKPATRIPQLATKDSLRHVKCWKGTAFGLQAPHEYAIFLPCPVISTGSSTPEQWPSSAPRTIP